MSRSKPKGRDPRGGHIRMYWDMLSSPAWLALTHTERSLYVTMRRQFKGSNNGDISATTKSLQYDGFVSSSTVFKSLRALVAVGLIAKSRQGGIAGFYGKRSCNLYRFTDEPVSEMPNKGISASKATHEWRQWTTKAEAEAAIAAAHSSALRPTTKHAGMKRNEAKLRPPNATASKAESEASNVRSIAEYRSCLELRQSNT